MQQVRIHLGRDSIVSGIPSHPARRFMDMMRARRNWVSLAFILVVCCQRAPDTSSIGFPSGGEHRAQGIRESLVIPRQAGRLVTWTAYCALLERSAGSV